VNQWCDVSIADLQSWQEGLWSQPVLSSLPDIQILFWKMSQVKNLQFGGAQVFQMETMFVALMQPLNWALYVEAVMYCVRRELPRDAVLTLEL
jgi:hypothetical protein